MVKPIQIPSLTPEQLRELHELYRKTRAARMRTRAQIILLAAEKGMTAPEIAGIVRKTDQTVRNWLKRYEAEGIRGLHDYPRPGSPRKVTGDFLDQLLETARRYPRGLGLPFESWTLRRLADYMAAQTGIRVDAETVRRYLKSKKIDLNRPRYGHYKEAEMAVQHLKTNRAM